MWSPVHPDTALQAREIEPGLRAYECPKSGGVWIPLQGYLIHGLEQGPEKEKAHAPKPGQARC